MMGAFAEFERNIIRKRQAEGIAKAKERGGLSTYKIADQMGISRMSVHRILNNAA
jgi:DNA invertase Pin-like site-specific DNA recombinase